MSNIIADRRSLADKLRDLRWGGKDFGEYLGDGAVGIAKTQLTNPANISAASAAGSSLSTQSPSFPYSAWAFIWNQSLAFQVGGCFGTGISNNGSLGVAISTEFSPLVVGYTSSAVANSSAGFGMINNSHHFRMFKLWSICCELTQTTGCRMWIGAGGSGNTADWVFDQPARNFSGFRFSATAGDTTWMCVNNTGNLGGQQTAVSSGVVPDLNFHLFQIAWDGTAVTFYIDNNKVGRIGTNVPNGLMNGPLGFVDNINQAHAVSCRFWYWSVLSKQFADFPPFQT